MKNQKMTFELTGPRGVEIDYSTRDPPLVQPGKHLRLSADSGVNQPESEVSGGDLEWPLRSFRQLLPGGTEPVQPCGDHTDPDPDLPLDLFQAGNQVVSLSSFDGSY